MKKTFALALTTLALPAVTFAEGAVEAAATGAVKGSAPLIAAAACIAVAAAVVGFSQSRAAVAALEGIARNPASAKPIQVPLILSLALMESLVLLAFVIAILLAL